MSTRVLCHFVMNKLIKDQRRCFRLLNFSMSRAVGPWHTRLFKIVHFAEAKTVLGVLGWTLVNP